MAAIAPEALLAAGLFAVAAAVRYLGFSLESRDVRLYLRPWVEFIQVHGGFQALRYDFADYNMPYLYVLVGIAWLTGHTSLEMLPLIKLVSTLFDAVLAFFVFKLVALRAIGWKLPLLASAVALLLPTVVFDGAYWAQCDSIYTTFLLAGVYFLLRDRPWLGTALFGLAFAVKLQAVFLFPVLLVLLLSGRLKWRCLVTIPAVCLAGLVPAAIAGRPLGELATVYLSQTGTYRSYLNLNSPSLYSFVTAKTSLDTISTAGILFAAAAVLLLTYALFVRGVPLDNRRIILLAAACAILVPFVLPSMHERYFYPADVLTLVAAFWLPRRLWYVPALMQFASFQTYQSYLFGSHSRLDLRLLTLFVFAALVAVTAELLRRDQTPTRPSTEAGTRPGELPELLPSRPA